MQYRKFGKTDFEVSALGFGCMRLPILQDNDALIDEEEAVKMIRYAIDNGVNYVDTAYPYHKGKSEIVVGKALKNGYRDKVKLATKSPVWFMKEYSDFDKYLNEQLAKLDTDHIDMYLLHALDKNRWENIKSLGATKFMDAALKEGKIKYAGFSFHGDLDAFKEIVDSYNWDFCQIQFNYMDINYQAGLEGLKYAAEKGLAIIVMEPLKGGKLAKNPPQEVKDVFEQAETKRTPAEWALHWIWNHPEVSVVLSGMSNMEQVEQNLKSANNSSINSFSKCELEIIDRVREKFNSLIKIDCTACGYCMPCPAGVNIPRNFAVRNEAHMYNDIEGYTFVYNNFFDEKSRASSCVECGQCEEQCPQHLTIREYLKEVHNTLKK